MDQPPDWNDARLPAAPAGARFVGGVVGFVFAGIGVTVLVFMWAAPFDDFHSPPMFFRVFASFIALAFVAVGGGIGVAAVRGRMGSAPRPPVSAARVEQSPGDRTGVGYKCPHCGAPLGEKADVSPSGDAKCSFCGRWFNVHRSAV